MTQAQREAIVIERLKRGFPAHRPPHPDLGAGWYLLTAATFEHRRHFVSSDELTALSLRIVEGFRSINSCVAAWIVLPNHYHVLAELDSLSQVGQMLGKIHGRSSRYANQRDATPGRKVWYKYSDRKIRNQRHYNTALHYVATNSVKHSYVDRASDWPWSNYHELIEANGVGWFDDLVRSYPLLNMGRGWDDV